MADARALLRAHRAENRIKHAHAAYSDAGKLLCKLCHEPVRSDSLWEGHIRSPGHRTKLQALQTTAADENGAAAPHKRKHDDVDESMSDADEAGEGEDLVRKKRSKVDMGAPSTGEKEKDKDKSARTETPPLLNRRTSGTPVQGVEIAIPSRPATPLAGGSTSSTSTPRITPMGRSPLLGLDSAAGTSVTAQQASLPISTESLAAPGTTVARKPISKPATNGTATVQPSKPSTVDEAEWAAFEAEMAAAADTNETSTNAADPNSTNAAAYTADAVISAPAMTAEQVAAKSQEEENARRKLVRESQIADEREDATRALEEEFEEMEELEGRVRRLKERREELRKGGVLNLKAAAGEGGGTIPKGVAVLNQGKENTAVTEDEDDDDDDDDADEWDGFRFRT